MPGLSGSQPGEAAAAEEREYKWRASRGSVRGRGREGLPAQAEGSADPPGEGRAVEAPPAEVWCHGDIRLLLLLLKWRSILTPDKWRGELEAGEEKAAAMRGDRRTWSLKTDAPGPSSCGAAGAFPLGWVPGRSLWCSCSSVVSSGGDATPEAAAEAAAATAEEQAWCNGDWGTPM